MIGYIAINFDHQIKTYLSLEKIIEDQHVTLVFKPTADQVDSLLPLIGKEVECSVIGYANDGKNEGYLVKLPTWVPYYNAAVPHITISIAEGAKPKDTGYLNFEKFSNDACFVLKGKISVIEW